VSDVAERLADGQLALSMPSLAPPVCENAAVMGELRSQPINSLIGAAPMMPGM